jgi:hypothetical protein
MHSKRGSRAHLWAAEDYAPNELEILRALRSINISPLRSEAR